jgi:hypothetical protein
LSGESFLFCFNEQYTSIFLKCQGKKECFLRFFEKNLPQTPENRHIKGNTVQDMQDNLPDRPKTGARRLHHKKTPIQILLCTGVWITLDYSIKVILLV